MKILILMLTFFACLSGYADTLLPASPVPSASGIPVTVTSAVGGFDPLDMQWMKDVFTWVTKFGGMEFMLKISGLITLIIASMKVSFARKYLWDKFPALKVWMAPILSGILGVIALKIGGNLTLATFGAYVFSGSGAILLHELLDNLKAIPGISPVYLSMISFFTSILGGPNPLPADTAIPAGMGTAAAPSANDKTTTS